MHKEIKVSYIALKVIFSLQRVRLYPQYHNQPEVLHAIQRLRWYQQLFISNPKRS